jgi:hypothetical protein
VLAIVAFFGDTGVGGALVRQATPPTDRQLSIVFYLQLAASFALMAAVAAAAGAITVVWPDLPADSALLMRVMAVDFVLVSLRIAPMLLLERRLRFGALSLIDVAGGAAFYGVAVVLAVLGWGVWALAGAVIGRACLVTAIAYAVSGWRPQATFAWAEVRPLMRFGLAQQSRNVISLVNDAVTPFWGGRELGVTAVGYLNWARQTAYFPLKMADTLRTVGFPLFARLQHDRALVGESLGRAIHLCAFVTCACVGLFIGLGELLTRYVFSSSGYRRSAAGCLPWRFRLASCRRSSRPRSMRSAAQVCSRAWRCCGRSSPDRRPNRHGTRRHTLGFAIGYASHVVIGNIDRRGAAPHAARGAVLKRIRMPFAGACFSAAAGRLVLDPYVEGPWSFGAAAIASLMLYVAVVWLGDRRALMQARSLVPGETAAASSSTQLVRAAG